MYLCAFLLGRGKIANTALLFCSVYFIAKFAFETSHFTNSVASSQFLEIMEASIIAVLCMGGVTTGKIQKDYNYGKR